MRKTISLLLCAILIVALASTAFANELPAIKLYGKCIEYTSGEKMTDKVIEILKDEINVEAIQIDWTNQNEVIRTGIASGEPCDVYNYASANIAAFADAAVDLTPYLDADPEFKSWFSDAALSLGSIDGKILDLPWETQGPCIIANKDLLDKLGIEIPDAWTYEEFMSVCQQIKDAGYWPMANPTDLNRSAWLWRCAIVSATKSSGTYDKYIAGELDFSGEDNRIALEKTKAMFDAGYMYPGEGAATVKWDEAKMAFYQGEVAFITETTASAKTTASGAEFTVAGTPWPEAVEGSNITFGGYNGFFIPQNCSNVDLAVKVLKTMLSPEVQAIHAQEGYVPANQKIDVEDEFILSLLEYANYCKDYSSNVEFVDYRDNQMMAELLLGGGVESCLASMSAF